jgi:hypothetical protein
MARNTGAAANDEVTDLFRQQCLVAQRPLLWPGTSAWTPRLATASTESEIRHDPRLRSSIGELLYRLPLHRSPSPPALGGVTH